MQVSVFSIRIDPAFLELDQKKLNEFLKTVTFKKSSTQLIESGEFHWSVIIHYENEAQNKPEQLERKSYDDLLPKDANSRWAQVNPAGQGDVRDQNFLNAGFLLGINTVGQSLKNANLQLRSEPPNPQDKVSPWNQSTIDPDLNRKPLEIGGCN